MPRRATMKTTMKAVRRCVAGMLMLLVTVLCADSADLTCASSTTLEELVTCIRNQMPGSGSAGFVVPSATEQAAWRSVVQQMLQGSCDFTLPASLAGIMQLRSFTDAENGRTYCVFME